MKKTRRGIAGVFRGGGVLAVLIGVGSGMGLGAPRNVFYLISADYVRVREMW